MSLKVAMETKTGEAFLNRTFSDFCLVCKQSLVWAKLNLKNGQWIFLHFILQEILRVHGRAARALANQSVPFSVCTILRDEDVFNIVENPKEQSDDKTKDVRSRYNGRLFLSWLQDVDDKWERIKVTSLKSFCTVLL